MHQAHGVTCPHLTTEKTCAVYAERFAPDQPVVKAMSLYVIGDELHTLYCFRITALIEKGLLHPDVEARCCYAHPELLDHNETLSDPEE